MNPGQKETLSSLFATKVLTLTAAHLPAVHEFSVSHLLNEFKPFSGHPTACINLTHSTYPVPE